MLEKERMMLKGIKSKRYWPQLDIMYTQILEILEISQKEKA